MKLCKDCGVELYNNMALKKLSEANSYKWWEFSKWFTRTTIVIRLTVS